MISDSVRFSCFYLCKFSGCCTCGDSQHRAMNVCVCATSRELIKCGPKRGLQPLKSEPEQSPHKIRGGSMGIFKANLKPHPLWSQKEGKGRKGAGCCEASGMWHTSRAGEDIAVDVHAYKCSWKASGRSFPWPWKPFYDVSVRLCDYSTPAKKPQNYAMTFSVV